MDIVTDLKSALKSAEPDIYAILKKDFREDLNKNVHVLDLSYSTLLSSTYSRLRNKLSDNELAAYSNAYSALIAVLLNKCNGRIVASINDPLVKTLVDKKFASGPILIYAGSGENTHAFLIGSQFSSLQKYYSNSIAGDPSLRASRFGKSTRYVQNRDSKGREIPDDYTKESRIKTDFGHIPTANDGNLTSPLVKKLESVINTATNPLTKRNAELAINELYSIQAKIAHRFKNTTPETIELGEGYVVITLQNKKLNSKFSTEEARIYSKLLRSIVNKIDYSSIRGSNTIKQDIAEGIANSIAYGKLKGRKVLKKHQATESSSTIQIKANTKVVASSSPGFNTVTTVPKETYTKTSIMSLEALLRARINEQVRQNMGSGKESRILNYRTGRFSESVSIERISESRQGMISVFYSYMKNPYATFSDGGRQQYPKTRDPKALISKSIREIAGPMVANRLRSVVV